MRQDGDDNALCMGATQRPRCLVDRGAGGEDVVHQEHRVPAQIESPADGERIVHVAAALCGSLPSLRGGAARATQPRRTEGQAKLLTEGMSENLALIEAAPP